jgi:hypothetical protein
MWQGAVLPEFADMIIHFLNEGAVGEPSSSFLCAETTRRRMVDST